VTATTATSTLSLHDALPIYLSVRCDIPAPPRPIDESGDARIGEAGQRHLRRLTPRHRTRRRPRRRLRNRAAVDVVGHAQDPQMRRAYLCDRLLNDALDSAQAAHTHDLAQGPIHHLRDITRRLKCAALVCLDDRSLDPAPRFPFQAGDQILDLTLD